ncbi:hypothetical protein OYE22_14985 [Streptomyces sp. 71268]|uniref:hypothetical protein n=1 Tax=Streptomyces sp. 71268 TaxID=3002640 RepID=UPI0023F91E97|nr:hypothetical protein [Streptomyces sp. 71268]WEV26354.1 hypothetical protein OYE22_14985 [Streptomyces sp. 71268]
MSAAEEIGAVVHLDLRALAPELDTARAVRDTVGRQLGLAGLPEPDHPMFLVVDTPAGLSAHQHQYELLTTYRAVGEVRIIVLLVGSAPGSYDDGESDGEAEDAYQADRRLIRPAVLRSSGTALLWAGDLRSARTALEQPAPDDPRALAVLVDVLSVPDVFLRVLADAGALPEAVAAPGVRLLEQDLPPEVRDRAWRDALTRFAGEDTELAPGMAGSSWSAADLPEPLRGLATGRAGRTRQHREAGGVADGAYRACAGALDDADAALAELQALPGLLGSARRDVFEADIAQAHRSLDEYRDLVGTALRSGSSTGTAPQAAEATTRLAALGLRVPSADGVGERIGEGLREFAGKLLGQGLALRAVAQRFTGLAGRVEPVPGSALLPRLAEHSPEAVAHRTRGSGDPVPAPAIGIAAAGLAGAFGGLWQGPLIALAALVPLVFIAVVVLGAARLWGSGHPDRWAVGPRVAVCAGAALGVAAGALADPPPWLGAAGLLLGLGLAVETARRLWYAAADAWALAYGIAELRQALEGLDALLADAVREHWAADERLYCADAARSVAGMLRATAAAAEAEARAEPTPAATPAADDAGPSAGDDWLTGPSALETESLGVVDGADADWASDYDWEGADAWGPVADPAPEAAPGAARGSAADLPADPWRSPETPRWLERETGEGGADLVATLTADLVDAAVVAMGPYWGAVERGQAGALAVRRNDERVRDLLGTARRHLQRNGVLAPPPFADRHRARPTSANLLGTDPHRVAELVGAEPERHAVVQLSSPEQATLLNRDPQAAVWLRFAPDAVRGDVERAWRASGAPQPDDALWTATGRYAGLIRLTPLRMGVVDTVRPRQLADDDGADGAYSADGATGYGFAGLDGRAGRDRFADGARPYDRRDGDRR